MRNTLMVTLAASAVLTPILVSCSQNTDTTLPVPTSAVTTTIVETTTIVPLAPTTETTTIPTTTRPPEPKCGNGETPQWLTDDKTWLCPAVTTTTQRPSPPECEGHTTAEWQSTRWRCARMPSSEAGLTCSRIENPSWDYKTSLWSCTPDTSMLRRCEFSALPSEEASEGYRRSADDIRRAGMVFRLIEIRGRLDSETVCTAEGIEYDYVVCSNGTWIYIASIKETANNPVVNAGRRCLNGIRAGTEEPLFELDCDAGLIERRDSSGTRRCYSSPECGSSLVARYVSESDRYVCSETEETASQFWEYAFHSRGIQGDYQKARWIGGLGSAYMKLTWTDSEWGLREWRFMNQASAEEHMLRIGTGKSHLYICYEHDCAKAGNLLGSTDFNVSGCHAFVWQTEEGLWFLMRIEESVPVCVRAFGKVVSGEINGASAGYSSSSKDTGRTVPKDEIERPVYYEYDVVFGEITLSQSSKNESPADKNTWVAAIDLRE